MADKKCKEPKNGAEAKALYKALTNANNTVTKGNKTKPSSKSTKK